MSQSIDNLASQVAATIAVQKDAITALNGTPVSTNVDGEAVAKLCGELNASTTALQASLPPHKPSHLEFMKAELKKACNKARSELPKIVYVAVTIIGGAALFAAGFLVHLHCCK